MVMPSNLTFDDGFEESEPPPEPEAVPGYEWKLDSFGEWQLWADEEIDEFSGRAARREELADRYIEEAMEEEPDPYCGDEDLE